MLKKLFIVSFVVFVITVSALVVQRVFFNGEEKQEDVASEIEKRTEAAIKETEDRTTDENIKRTEKIIKLVEEGVKGATIADGKEQVLYYNNQRFLLIDFNGGTKSSVGAYPFVDVKSISWDSKKKKSIIKDRKEFFVYDLDRNDVKKMGENVDAATWEEKGSRILYKYYDEETQKRAIGLMQLDNEELRTVVEDIPYKIVDFLSVPRPNQVCYFPVPETNTKEFLRCYDWETKQVVLEYDGNFGSDYLWSSDGNNLLVSYLQERGGNRLLTGVSNEKGSELKSLSFSTTTKKCVWSKDNKNIYCAMMSGVSDLMTLPNDWDSGKFNSTDTFWKINTVTGEKKRLIDVDKIPSAIDVINLLVDKSEKYLFFTDKKSGALYRLSL